MADSVPDSPALEALIAATDRYASGDILGALADLDSADALATEPEVRAAVLVQKASWLREVGSATEAAGAIESAERTFLDRGEPIPSFIRASILLEKGIVASRAGQLLRAEQLLLEAKAEAEGEPWAELTVPDVLANLAGTYLTAGRLADAQAAATEALRLDRDLGNTRSISNDLNVLGLVYAARGERKLADQTLREALATAVEGGFVQQAQEAAMNLASGLDAAGLHDEARAAQEQLTAAAAEFGDAASAASAKANLAISLARAGDTERARELTLEALEEHRAADDNVHEVVDLQNLAQYESELGHGEQAYAYASEAARKVDERGLLEFQWSAQLLLARCRGLAGGEPRQMLADIFAAYDRAAEGVELLRASVGRPEERAQILRDKEAVFEEAAVTAALVHDGRRAFRFSDRARGRAFLEAMGADRIASRALVSPLTKLREEVTVQLLAAEDDGVRARLAAELREVRARVLAEAPRISAITESELVDVDGLAELLPESAAIVEFFVVRGQLLTSVVTKAGVVALTLADLGEIDLAREVKQLRAEIQFPPRIGASGVALPPSGELLFLALFAEIWRTLDPSPVMDLLIIPDKELHYVPFSALWFSNSGAGPSIMFLRNRFRHAVLPSAAFLPHCLAMPRPTFEPGSALVLGNPTGDLDGAEDEAVAVAAQLGVEPMLGEHATRAAFLERASGCGVVHVACHGSYDDSDPLLSGIELADGRVTVEDMMGATLDAGVVVLSGCVTGLARRHPGDELVGLARAAISAGTPSVATALWNIDDRSSGRFWTGFYDHLAGGATKSEALWEAQFELIAEQSFAAPQHWSPYVLLGDWH